MADHKKKVNCADCEYHECSSICLEKGKSNVCDGFCISQKTHQCCSKINKCVYYKKDKFFMIEW